jgi:hypothetical protein
MAALANVSFTSTPPSGGSPPVAAVPGELDPEHAAIRAALEAGTIPTFVDDADSTPAPPPKPIDPAAEREAFAQFVAFINARKDPNTIVTITDPATYAKSFT